MFNYIRLEPPSSTIQILPKFRARIAVLLILLVLGLALVALANSGPGRFLYAGLCILTLALLIARYRKETALIRDHQSVPSVVTEYRVRGRGAPHMWSGIPNIKYSFRAFDGRTYMGETSSRVSGLREGTQLIILYLTSNPDSSLPLCSFIFYSFQGVL